MSVREHTVSDDVLPAWRVVALLARYIIGYNFVYIWILKSLYAAFPQPGKIFYQAIFYIVYFAVSVWLAWPLLKDSTRRLKGHVGWTAAVVVFALVAMLLVSGQVSALAAELSGATDSRNQLEINQALTEQPLFIMAVTVIFSPLVEELVFRACIFRPLQRRGHLVAGIVISAVLFGLLHVYESMLDGDLADGWYALTYASMGVFMSLAYVYADNFWAPVLLHATNNALVIFLLMR